jgi:hypothetical protein
MTSQVELQTTQSVSHATGTPHPTLGRQWCLHDVIVIFIDGDHRVLIAIRKDELAADSEEAHKKILLAALGAIR